LGVVGVIVPWNFPLNLSLVPLSYIFAAGNRAMVKMSENSRHLAAYLIEHLPAYFPPEKLQIFDETGGVGLEFSKLKFDHLLFTGSGQTGRSVMASAARNLTPVTLELGGKSPAIVAPDFPIGIAAERIIWAKLFNAGQVCTTVDHVYIPAGTEAEFIQHCQRLVAARVPDINGPDYTSIIDGRAYARLEETLRDAQQKGATLINLAPGQVPDTGLRKFPPHLVLGATDDMIVMQREIFGPILPVLAYRDRQAVVDQVNARDRPLAIYPFTHDSGLLQFYLTHIMSGGVSVNDALLHVVQHDLPFGGIGASGMGHYHGCEGFNTFSKLRPVFHQGRFSLVQKLFQPPYGGRPMRLLKFLMRLRS
jgi:coniferyl-aldehyde dehydrogenase